MYFISIFQENIDDVSSESEIEEPAVPSSPPPPKAKKRKRSKKVKVMMEEVSSLSESEPEPVPKKKAKKRWVCGSCSGTSLLRTSVLWAGCVLILMEGLYAFSAARAMQASCLDLPCLC